MKKHIKTLSFIMAMLLIFSNPLSLLADSKMVDSIGSINMEDDGVTIGFDQTQDKTTTYSESIESDGPQDTLVYVSQASTFGVFIPKTIVLSGQDKNANYLVRVSGNIGGTETIKVVPDKTFNLSQYGKKDIVANVSQDKTFWFFNEIDVNGNGEIIANDMSAGSWNGKFNFNISLGGAIIVEAKDSNGNDLQASASEIVGEEKSKLLNALVENDFISSINEVNALINVESNDFEEFANTTFNVSNIAKENDKIVILHFAESRQEWEYISTETVDNEGKINANFKSFSPIAFVKVKEDGSYGKHECIYIENICLGCKSKEPGLYDSNGIMLCNWEQSGIDIEKNYTTSNYRTEKTAINYIITNKYPKTTMVIIPNEVTTIGSYSIRHCNTLTSVILPSTLKYINEGAFNNCYGLTSIIIPDNVISIGNGAFNNCENLKSVVIGLNVESIGSYAFNSCYNINNMVFKDTTTWYIGNKEGAIQDTRMINSNELANTTTAANYLKISYTAKFWVKK